MVQIILVFWSITLIFTLFCLLSFFNFGQVRTLEVGETSMEEVKNFEYTCLGEVRILGALRHPCIVELYGHQISSKWVPSVDGKSEHRVLKSAILMEYVKGGPLKVCEFLHVLMLSRFL